MPSMAAGVSSSNNSPSAPSQAVCAEVPHKLVGLLLGSVAVDTDADAAELPPGYVPAHPLAEASNGSHRHLAIPDPRIGNQLSQEPLLEQQSRPQPQLQAQPQLTLPPGPGVNGGTRHAVASLAADASATRAACAAAPEPSTEADVNAVAPGDTADCLQLKPLEQQVQRQQHAGDQLRNEEEAQQRNQQPDQEEAQQRNQQPDQEEAQQRNKQPDQEEAQQRNQLPDQEEAQQRNQLPDQEEAQQPQPGASGPLRPHPHTALAGDPDYEIPRGTMTETQVLLQKQQRQDRPVRVDRHGFVITAQEAPDGDGAASAAAEGPQQELRRRLWLLLRQRRRRQEREQREQLDRQNVGRLRKWRKMLGPSGDALEHYQRRKPEKLKRRLHKGVPDQLRGLAWLVMSGGRKLLAAHPGAFAALASDEAAAGRVVGLASSTPVPVVAAGGPGPPLPPSLDPAVDASIMRDLNRTFPTHIFFSQRQGPGQRALYTVLRAFAMYDPGVGYVQGMGFLAAVLLLYLDAEEAFWTLVAFMQGPPGWLGVEGLRRLYTPGMPGLQCCLFQFKHLLSDAAPLLAARMEREGVDPALYATHWFNTAFAYTLPFDHLLRVWDVFVAEGLETLFRVGLAVLQYAEPRLSRLPFEALVESLSAKNLPALLPLQPEELIRRALRIPVAHRLEELRREWYAVQRNGQHAWNGQRQSQSWAARFRRLVLRRK